jgi:CheY-like chemotaxis protein
MHPSAIIMDMQLPVMDGWTVLQKLKANKSLADIPVHVMSAMDRQKLGMEMGATAYLRKPLDMRDLDNAFTSIDDFIENDTQHVLVIEDDPIQQQIVGKLVIAHHGNIKVETATNSAEAKKILSSSKINCVILDLDLGKGPQEGLSLLELLKNGYPQIPVIVYTGTELSEDFTNRVKEVSEALVTKEGLSTDRLLKETEAFLHCIKDKQNESIRQPQGTLQLLAGKKVLLVDDDVRNIYAITSVLESNGMNVMPAYNGREALDKLNSATYDIVLMDIMMPEMDGYTAMREIRRIDNLVSLPIIALTAKAMVGDREKCLQSGASDYISKPVNTDQLISLISVWLYKQD